MAHHPHDPSWCARLHARPAPAPRAVSGSEPAPRPSPEPVRARLFERREVPTVHECELCGTTMFDHNCKIICPNCGYKRDCSDP
jgi:ribosomal protein L32